MIQQELTPQVPPPPADDGDELYDDEPRRRPWGAITSVVLALALVFVGYQWHQASGREQAISTQVGSLRAEAETQRLRAEEAQRQTEGLQRRLTAMAARLQSRFEAGLVVEIGKVSEAEAVARHTPVPDGAEAAAPTIDNWFEDVIETDQARPVFMDPASGVDSFFLDPEKVITEWPALDGRMLEDPR